MLAEDAVFDIDEIWAYLLEKEGAETADRVLAALFRGLHKLADNPAIGHRRTDLTDRNVLFYRVHSWLIIYQPQPGKPLPVLAVLHAKRNVARLLQKRLM